MYDVCAVSLIGEDEIARGESNIMEYDGPLNVLYIDIRP